MLGVDVAKKMRKKALSENGFYHIYNRGVDKRTVFLDDLDYRRFLLSIDLLNDEKDGLMQAWRDYKRDNPQMNIQDFLKSRVRKRNALVKIITYSLISNHYHFILEQVSEKGIEKFMQKLGNSFTKYFNERHERNGALFQGKFKSSHISSTSQLLRLSVYVNCNSEIHKIHPAKNYKWCSFADYLKPERSSICQKKVIMDNFENPRNYEEYAKENISSFQQEKEDQKLVLE
ncbi:MAG: hypothetical protein A2359_02475 [Candidatus Moranbacteria bacterium RIFOXYB1_FULL_43_19]|nr:MAG: hypothetical protein A2359_02475 [Candidatus Moranbacteria bacterium RIFOXYB1_FULL_43_19]OGI28240.1 MAG: hypothetical protein A2184_01500 [Candidatus Moranbacteria bacterium RIFOXYA1_FULL_44_7]OGI33694.1 MAG: hypothetical protein A2420_01045 [Candidatus Moranbacteria bacterium RIFOXYC1_FULL_44_13]OGI37778.1 MAG: hypothetical protein A2612_04220 [Candidatus Moranbacteria bacterium RIFOXYD1_FULL_44_12]